MSIFALMLARRITHRQRLRDNPIATWVLVWPLPRRRAALSIQGLSYSNELAPLLGIEPRVSALRGLRPNRLDHSGKVGGREGYRTLLNR